MKIVDYYNYKISVLAISGRPTLKLDIDIMLDLGTDYIQYESPSNIDVFFFVGNPTLMRVEYGTIGIRHILPQL